MDPKKLAKRISQARERVGLSQEQTEQILELGHNAMFLIESAKRRISTLELTKLAKLFDTSIEELLDDEAQDTKYLKPLNFVEELEKIYTRPIWQKEIKGFVLRLIILAYRQEKISRGFLMEFCDLVGLPAVAVLEMAQDYDP